MKPLFSWGRNSSYDINMIEPFLPVPDTYNKYIEPFAGSASMFFHLAPQFLSQNQTQPHTHTISSILNDTNEDLMNFYQQIKDGNGSHIKTFMDTHENSKDVYYDILHNYCPATPIDQASQFYYLRKTCHRGMLRFNRLGLFNVAFGNNPSIDYSALINPEYSRALGNTTIMNGDFEAVFTANNSEDNFMFIDPPADETFKNDAVLQFTQSDHMRLYKNFMETDSKCLITIKDTPFIKELYIDYIIAAYPMQGKSGTKLVVSNNV